MYINYIKIKKKQVLLYEDEQMKIKVRFFLDCNNILFLDRLLSVFGLTSPGRPSVWHKNCRAAAVTGIARKF